MNTTWAKAKKQVNDKKQKKTYVARPPVTDLRRRNEPAPHDPQLRYHVLSS